MKYEEIISTHFLNNENRDKTYALLSEFLYEGILFKSREKVIEYLDQNLLMSFFDKKLPVEGIDMDLLLKEVKSHIVKYSVNFGSKNFIAFPDSGNSIASLAGHVLYGFLNQNLLNSKRTAPIATFVELNVISWLRQLVGYAVKEPNSIFDVGGINVNGGVSANTIAMLLAREKRFPNTLEKGIQFNTEKIKVLIPKTIDHYSITASLGWIGLGNKNVVELETDENFHIDKSFLTKILNDNSIIPIALVAYAGDSRTMSIDDFDTLAEICMKHSLWFHIDACHGLSLCFSDELKHKVRGINKADSITFDPHKVLFTPYTCSYLLLKEPGDFKLISGVSDLITKEEFSFGQITPFYGTRSFDSLKLWMTIKNIGIENIGKIVAKRHHLANYLSLLINNEDSFYVLNDITINSVVFIYAPEPLRASKNVLAINELNAAIHETIFRQGDFYCHTFRLTDIKNKLEVDSKEKFQVLRCMIGNPLTNENSLSEFVKNLVHVAKKLYNDTLS